MFAGIHNKDTFLEISAKELLDILPHRYPFLLVDRILSNEPGVRAVGRKNVSFGEPFFVGHFPGHPIMPGVLIIEMMAQVGGVMLLTLPEHNGKLAYLATVAKARFRKPVLPGDTLLAEVSLIRARGTMGVVKAEAKVDGVLVCEAELMFALQSPNGEEKTAE
ncbi:MAG: 3-hydroxyacyl-ACP dehydratase FabZ [Fibrella sp.]|nr:3-hydroxyacyl-ACP dehydratase FabZ [Armatimonadota bacterium]